MGYKACDCVREYSCCGMVFECDYEGNVDGFDGVTIAEFDADMKICDLKEFQSKAEHNYPYGE